MENISVVHILVYLFLVLVLYYLYALEKVHCKCKLDYKHKLLKTLSYISLVMLSISLTSIDNELNNLGKKPVYSQRQSYEKITTIHFSPYRGIQLLIFIIYFITLFSYVRSVNNEKCSCALHDVRTTNNFLSLFKYLFLIVGVFAFIWLIEMSVNYIIL
jgi:magnesium-transporting ATPase (P-type)